MFHRLNATRLVVLSSAFCLLLLPSTVFAQNALDSPVHTHENSLGHRPNNLVDEAGAHIPVRANFSTAELITTALVFPTGLALNAVGGKFWEQPSPSMGAPNKNSLDYRISERFHGDLTTGNPLWGGAPDYGAYLLGSLPAIYYLGSSAYLMTTGETLFDFQDRNIHHRTLAFTQTIGWTSLITVGMKFFAGRERPYLALDRPEFAWNAHEENLSFFSGHTSLSFAASTFLYRTISNDLVRNHLADWAPHNRFIVGRVVPFTFLYGAASVVGLSRIYDQKHYASDVMIGAVIGTLVSSLVYNTHFDEYGAPRRRFLQDTAIQPTLVTNGQSAHIGWALSGSW